MVSVKHENTITQPVPQTPPSSNPQTPSCPSAIGRARSGGAGRAGAGDLKRFEGTQREAHYQDRSSRDTRDVSAR